MERGLVDIPQDHSIQYNTRSSGKHFGTSFFSTTMSGILYPQPLCRANH